MCVTEHAELVTWGLWCSHSVCTADMNCEVLVLLVGLCVSADEIVHTGGFHGPFVILLYLVYVVVFIWSVVSSYAYSCC